MSMKTSYLLTRCGRNQFGDSGDIALPRYVPSSEALAQDDLMRKEHIMKNDEFLLRHKEQWLSIFKDKKTLKGAWEVVFQQGKPSYSKFCKECKEFSSLEEYLCFLLLSMKRRSLFAMGFSKEEITSELNPFKYCGSYFVAYGKSSRTFYTPL